jgi:endonuclease YncB( thermonuclease family)
MKIGALILAAALAGIAVPAAGETIIGQARVIDGDTLMIGGGRVRLFGIDAPEAAQTCLKGWTNRRCGEDAAVALRALIEGANVSCSAVARDVYKRAVAVCMANGADVGESLLGQGLAVALDDATEAYRSRARQAEANGSGIWGSRFQIPADFRAANPRNANESLAGDLAPPAMLAQPAFRERAIVPRQPSAFRNCAAARAAGVAPLYRGQPGYGAHMDSDGDGIACEPYRGRQ